MKRCTRYLLFCCCLFIALLSGCSSSGGEVDTQQNIPQTSGEITELESVEVPSNLDQAAAAYLFDYTMPSVTGSATVARALLFQPFGSTPVNGLPLIVWAHGTTGIANACAPSSSFDDFGNAIAVNALLAAGYAVLAPDYEGYGTPTIHPYYQRASHANAVLAAVAAAHLVDGVFLTDTWAVVGHSQGGHVALSTARAEQNPSYPLQAVAALAPGTDLRALSDRAFEAVDLALAQGETEEAAERIYFLNVYGAYVAHAVQLVDPAFDPASMFGNTVSEFIDEAVDEIFCGTYADTVFDTLRAHLLGGGTVLDFAGLKRDWYNAPQLPLRLAAEELGDEAQTSPLLVVQGDADRQVPIEATTAFVNLQQSLGTDVTYQVVTGGRHGSVAREEIALTIDWLAERFPAQ